MFFGLAYSSLAKSSKIWPEVAIDDILSGWVLDFVRMVWDLVCGISLSGNDISTSVKISWTHYWITNKRHSTKDGYTFVENCMMYCIFIQSSFVQRFCRNTLLPAVFLMNMVYNLSPRYCYTQSYIGISLSIVFCNERYRVSAHVR
jgi:hypothetical protein